MKIRTVVVLTLITALPSILIAIALNSRVEYYRNESEVYKARCLAAEQQLQKILHEGVALYEDVRQPFMRKRLQSRDAQRYVRILRLEEEVERLREQLARQK